MANLAELDHDIRAVTSKLQGVVVDRTGGPCYRYNFVLRLTKLVRDSTVVSTSLQRFRRLRRVRKGN
jgi:hypothetical protein